MKRYALFAALLASSLLIAGCTSTTTDSAETTANTNLEADELYDEDYDDEIDVVKEDVYGKDLEIVDRYPNSVRSYYSSSEYETDVSYQTSADQEEIREFYVDALNSGGWELSEDATDYMEFVRGDDDNPEYFTLYLTEYEDQGIVEYEVVYEPPLSDEELEEFDEDEDFEIEL